MIKTIHSMLRVEVNFISNIATFFEWQTLAKVMMYDSEVSFVANSANLLASVYDE